MSDEELLKVVEDIELNMVKKMSDEELLKAVKHIKSPLFEFKFRPWGRENVGRKMWWRNNGLQHAWKKYANLHQMIMLAFQSLMH